ncbi:MAG: TIGR04086 family membrane protein [Clostridia bacterium]|nr:TIGR04086 family membrane protein [Clostridia bacterium]
MSDRKRSKTNSKILSYVKTEILSIIIFGALLVILSAVCVKADINKESMSYIALVFIGVISLTTGFLFGIRERKNGIVCGILGALPVNLLIIAVSLIINKFSVDINILYTALVCLVSSSVGGIVSVNIRMK